VIEWAMKRVGKNRNANEGTDMKKQKNNQRENVVKLREKKK